MLVLSELFSTVFVSGKLLTGFSTITSESDSTEGSSIDVELLSVEVSSPSTSVVTVVETSSSEVVAVAVPLLDVAPRVNSSVSL